MLTADCHSQNFSHLPIIVASHNMAEWSESLVTSSGKIHSNLFLSDKNGYNMETHNKNILMIKYPLMNKYALKGHYLSIECDIM